MYTLKYKQYKSYMTYVVGNSKAERLPPKLMVILVVMSKKQSNMVKGIILTHPYT
jgi:hypothetical protein